MTKRLEQGSDIKPERKGAGIIGMLKKLTFALLGIYIVPLLLITYLYVQYIFPMFVGSGQEENGLSITAMLTFAVIVSLLGLYVISKLIKDSGNALQGINANMGRLLSSTKRFEEEGFVDTLVDSVAAAAKDMLDAEASSLLLYDDAGALRFEYVEGPASNTLKGKAIKPGEGIAGWSAKEGKPVIKNDVNEDPRFTKRFDKESGFVTKSILCVPLVFGGRCMGVIEAINKRDASGFTEEDLNSLSSLAGHAAAAIHRSKTISDLKGDFVHLVDIIQAAIDNFMPQKKGHSKRVAEYSVKLARGLGLTEGEVRNIYFGAILHDIGLIKCSAYPASRDKEWYKLHSTLGWDMVKNISQWKEVGPMIRDHHERYDGCGYPSGLKGEDITLGGRIIGLAEAFDVMTSCCSYKTPRSFHEAAEEIRALSAFQFDPMVAGVFLRDFTGEDVITDEVCAVFSRQKS